MNNNIDKILNDIMTLDFDINPSVVFLKNNDHYVVYNKYDICRHSFGYTVNVIHTFTELKFVNLVNAITWCGYDYRNKIYDCNRIIDLDKSLADTLFEIKLREKMMKKTIDIESYGIYEAKLSESVLKKNHILKMLRRYIDDGIEWQTKKFNTQSLKK
jgi:hypothetical protein